MPQGSQTFLPMLARPSTRKAKVTDSYTGQVLQQAGPYSPAEYGELREASAALPRLPNLGGGGAGGTGMTRGRPMLPNLRGGRGVRQVGFATAGDGERVAIGLPRLSGTGGGGGNGGPNFGRGPVRGSAVTLPDLSRSGGGGGGGGSATYSDKPRLPILSERDGSTVAPRSGAAGNGLNDFYARNPQSVTSSNPAAGSGLSAAADLLRRTGAAGSGIANAFSSFLPHAEKGGRFGPGAVVVGDSSDGRENRELVIAPGGATVVPLGTGVPADGPVRLPDLSGSSVEPGATPGVLMLKPNPYGYGMSFDAGSAGSGRLPNLSSMPEAASGRMVDASDLPAGSRLPAAADPLSPRSAVVPADKSAFETWREYVARREAMNPEDIEVGVTPRAPLTNSSRLPQLSAEERRYARAEKDVWRAARNDMHLALRLLDRRDQSMSAAEAARGREALARFTQGQLNERHQATIDAQNARAETARKDKEDEAKVKWQQELFKTNAAETFKQLGQQREAEQARQSFPIVDPTTGEVNPNYFMTGTNVTLPSSRPPSLQPLEGTGLAYPMQKGEMDLARPFIMSQPQQTMPTYPNATVVPPKFEPVPTKPVDPVKAAGDRNKARLALLTSLAQLDELSTKEGVNAETLKRINSERSKLLADFDGDGVPDVLQQGGGSAGGAAGPKVTGGFLNAVK